MPFLYNSLSLIYYGLLHKAAQRLEGEIGAGERSAPKWRTSFCDLVGVYYYIVSGHIVSETPLVFLFMSVNSKGNLPCKVKM